MNDLILEFHPHESLMTLSAIIFTRPDPIEFIWKSLKRQISNAFIFSEMHLKHIVQVLFYRLSWSLPFAKSRFKESISEEFIKCNKLGVGP
ncbi:MAG: hypothetical protein ACP5UZ_08345 [Thermoplasmata archaeon]